MQITLLQKEKKKKNEGWLIDVADNFTPVYINMAVIKLAGNFSRI